MTRQGSPFFRRPRISSSFWLRCLAHIKVVRWNVPSRCLAWSYRLRAWRRLLTITSICGCSVSLASRSAEEQRKEIRKQDAILNIIIDAAEQLHPVKISLKSRKVYIGLIQAEQFERPDLDDVTTIPFYSGHRDKDTLNIIFDSNYIKAYEKHYGEIFSNDSTNSLSPKDMQKLEEFRIVIRLSEIESISFFDLAYYFDDFAERPQNILHVETQ